MNWQTDVNWFFPGKKKNGMCLIHFLYPEFWDKRQFEKVTLTHAEWMVVRHQKAIYIMSFWSRSVVMMLYAVNICLDLWTIQMYPNVWSVWIVCFLKIRGCPPSWNAFSPILRFLALIYVSFGIIHPRTRTKKQQTNENIPSHGCGSSELESKSATLRKQFICLKHFKSFLDGGTPSPDEYEACANVWRTLWTHWITWRAVPRQILGSLEGPKVFRTAMPGRYERLSSHLRVRRNVWSEVPHRLGLHQSRDERVDQDLLSHILGVCRAHSVGCTFCGPNMNSDKLLHGESPNSCGFLRP